MFAAQLVRAHSTRVRFASAAWASAGVHLAIAISIAVMVREPTSEVTESAESDARTSLMWIQSTGRIGGGGSHGDRTNTVAPRAERPGEARLTVPVPVARAASSEALREPPIQEIRIPALPEASDLREVPGMVREFATANVFALALGSGRGSGDGEGNGLDRGIGGQWGGGSPGAGGPASSPELIRQVRPNYTSPALQARVQGVVVMDAVVLPDGSVGEVKIVRSLDGRFGLDEEALKAVKQWRFRPAARAGRPIAMLVSVEMMFELR